jgi:hypothetical protein
MFDQFTSKKLEHYIYRIIDPQNCEAFYVGKGQNALIKQIKTVQKNRSTSIYRLKMKLDQIEQSQQT